MTGKLVSPSFKGQGGNGARDSPVAVGDASIGSATANDCAARRNCATPGGAHRKARNLSVDQCATARGEKQVQNDQSSRQTARWR